MSEIDELRPLTAEALLDIRSQTAGEDWAAEERGLRRNAQVLSQSCYWQGERVFSDGAAVLGALTVSRMEELLARLLRGGGRLEPSPNAANAGFDAARYAALRGEC